MQKLLLKLLTLLEIGMGIFLLLIGLAGTFSYFLFNVLIGVMGFLVMADGLSKIDDPSKRDNNNRNQGGDHDDESHHHGGHRFGSGTSDSDES